MKFSGEKLKFAGEKKSIHVPVGRATPEWHIGWRRRGHRPPAAGAAGTSRSASLARDPGAGAAHLYAAGGWSSHGRVLRAHLVQQRGGGGRGLAAAARRPAAPAVYHGANGQRWHESTYTSDELCIPYSTGMLGSFSPYRSSPYPRELTCFECQAVQHHYATECPSRFVRVRGKAPPGWKVDSPGRAAKDESAWNGSELTDAARARYREFITKLSLQPHVAFLVTVDDIVGPAPVPNRRPIPRPGRGRGR